MKIKIFELPPPGKSSVPDISFRFEGIRSTSAKFNCMSPTKAATFPTYGGFSAPQIWAANTQDEGCVGSLVELFLS